MLPALKKVMLTPVVLCVFFFATTSYLAAATVTLSPDRQKYTLGRFLDVFEDPGSDLGIDDISSGKYDRLFKKNETEVPSFGINTSAYWLSFAVANPGDRDRGMLLELAFACVDYVDCYVETGKGLFRATKTGDRRPYATRELDYRTYVFKVSVPAHESRRIYLKVRSHDGLNESTPLLLWEPDALRRDVSDRDLILGLYLGVLIVMGLYNLFIFFSVRDKSYLFYVLYLLLFSLHMANYYAITFRLWWPNSPWWQNHVMPLGISVCVSQVLLFSSSFLNAARLAPVQNRIIMLLIAAYLVNAVASLFMPFVVGLGVVVVLGIPVIVILVVTAVMCYRRGQRAARYYLLAWFFMLLGAFLIMLKIFSLLPSNLVTENVFPLGSAIECILLSLGLADRINIERGERLKAQQESLEHEKEARLAQAQAFENMQKAALAREQLLMIQRELTIARSIQLSIIPEHVPEIRGLDIAVRYSLTEEVGGDLYDYLLVDDRRIGVLVADVSGHGIPAALIAAMVKVAFSHELGNASRPSTLLANIRETMKRNLGKHFISAVYLFIDTELGKLVCARAGHPPILIDSTREENAEVRELLPRGRLISSLPDSDFEEISCDLRQGDRIIVYTDGIIEEHGHHGDLFGYERVESIIRMSRGMGGAVLAGTIINELGRWSGNMESHDDDITLLVIDVTG